MSGSVLVVSGPSGSGKSSLIKEILGDIGDYYFSISTTTRPPREGEKDGVDYFFVSQEEFGCQIERGNFLEYANVHGNYYGTSIGPVLEAIEAGKLVIFDIDVQGHRSIRQKLGDVTISVFVTTPALSTLRQRLENRGTDTPQTIAKRLANAAQEIEAIVEYDFLIINDDFAESASSLLSIAKAARLKRRKTQIKRFIEEWKNH